MERRVGVGVVSTSMVVALGGLGEVVGVWDAGGAPTRSSARADAYELNLTDDVIHAHLRGNFEYWRFFSKLSDHRLSRQSAASRRPR